MLRVLREHATSWMLKAILILVAVTFVSWGGYSLIREKEPTYAAMVNDQVIDLKEYLDAYQNTVRQYREALGPAFNEKMLAELKLKDRLLDDFINRVLIVQEGKRLGLQVHDQELRDTIQAIPSFQVDGQFDARQYERFLRLNRMSPEAFEQSQRERILISRMIHLVRQNISKPSEQEVRDVFLLENERMNLNFVKVSPEGFKNQIKTNEIEVKDDYSKNQEEFRTPTLIQIQYLAFRPADYEAAVQVSDEDVKKAYENRKDRLKAPKQVRAREILIAVNPQDPPEKLEEKKKKAEGILEQAKTTKDFGALARKVSESNTAPRGGELGWVQKGMLDDSLEAALFSLKAGELSGLVLGAHGFSILKAEEVKEEKQKSLEEARAEIIRSVKAEKGKSLASRKAEDAFYSVFKNRDLEKYAQENHLSLKTTPVFKEGDELPEFGRDPNFSSSAFSLKQGEISPVVQVGPNFYVLKMGSKKESRIPPFEEVKEEATRRHVSKKADEKARQVAENLLKQVRDGKDVRETAREAGYPVEETGFFNRTAGMIPKIGPVKESGGLLAPLTGKNPFPKEVIQTKDGYFVVRLLSTEPADPNKFGALQKVLEKRLTTQKQEEYFQDWLNQLKSKAKIEINQDALKF